MTRSQWIYLQKLIGRRGCVGDQDLNASQNIYEYALARTQEALVVSKAGEREALCRRIGLLRRLRSTDKGAQAPTAWGANAHVGVFSQSFARMQPLLAMAGTITRKPENAGETRRQATRPQQPWTQQTQSANRRIIQRNRPNSTQRENATLTIQLS